MGGRRSGCRFFLDGTTFPFLSSSIVAFWPAPRGPACLWLLGGGSRPGWFEMLPVEVLWILLASKARLDFRFSRNDMSAGESFGDSYTLGIAGTGGTSSSSSGFAGFGRFSAFGAGRRELTPGASLGWIEPVDVRTVLKLVEDPTDRPELYDLRLGSGVVRDEDGVEVVFRGSMDGDREEERTSAGRSGVAGA